MERDFCVRFVGNIEVFVRATNHENALRNARRKGYLARWEAIYPITPEDVSISDIENSFIVAAM